MKKASAKKSNTRTSAAKNRGDASRSTAARNAKSRAPTRKVLTAQQERAQKRSNRIAMIAVFLVTAVIIGGILWYYATEQRLPYVVRVNNVPITQAQLDFQYRLLPPEYQSLFNEQQVLDQIIDEEVVVQAARARGVVVTDEDVNERVQQILGNNEIAPQDLGKNLAMLNITVEQFESLVRRQLMIDRFRDSNIDITQPTDEQLQNLYEQNKARFEVGEQVTVRHVLVSTQREDAAVIAKSVYDDAAAGKNFCDLVLNASDDRGSRDRCGEYTFPRGYMVPDFEKTSFDMNNGETRMIQTQFGYHIIQKLNGTNASMRTFEEVKEDLRNEYLSSERATQYRALIDSLRATSTIVYQNGTVVIPTRGVPTASAGAIDDTQGDAPGSLPNDESVTAPMPQEVKTGNNPVVADTAAPNAAQATDKALYACIAKETLLYGTTWSSDTKDAIDQFAKYGVELPYVACDNNPKECRAVKAYPTWSIAGQQYVGRMSVEELKAASDC